MNENTFRAPEPEDREPLGTDGERENSSAPPGCFVPEARFDTIPK